MFHKQRPRPWLITVVCLGLLTLISCSTDKGSVQSLVIAEARQPAFGLVYIAEHQGYFSDQGLQVEYKVFQSGRDALEAALTGEADLGTTFDIPVVAAIANKRDVSVVSTLGNFIGNNVVVGRKDRQIHVAEDLQGKVIAYTSNTSANYVVERVLAEKNLSTQAIRHLDLPPADAADALISGRVDAAAIWPPHVQNALSGLGQESVTVLSSNSYYEFVMLAGDPARIQEKREAIHRFLTALLQAEDFLNNYPAKAMDIVVAELDNFKPDDARQNWHSYHASARLNNALISGLSSEVDWYLKNNDIRFEHPINVTDFITPDLLSSVRSSAVTIKQ